MNASQRRKAFRKIKSFVGKAIEMTLKTGVVRSGVVLGLTKPVLELGSMPTDYSFSGTRPSLHRLKVRLESKATMSPSVSQIRFLK